MVSAPTETITFGRQLGFVEAPPEIIVFGFPFRVAESYCFDPTESAAETDHFGYNFSMPKLLFSPKLSLLLISSF